MRLSELLAEAIAEVASRPGTYREASGDYNTHFPAALLTRIDAIPTDVYVTRVDERNFAFDIPAWMVVEAAARRTTT